MRPLGSIAIVLAALAGPLAADDVPPELLNEYRQAFRALDVGARLAVVENAAARGDLAGAKLLVEIVRRDDEALERSLWRKRVAHAQAIDAIFGAAIRDKRMLTGDEDRRLQGVKGELAAVDRDVEAVVEVRWRAMEALEAFADQAARAWLLEVAEKDRDWFVRYAAVRAAGRGGEPDPAEALGRIAAGEDAPQVVSAALDAIGRLGARSALEAVLARLESRDWPVRAAAAASLAAIGDLRAVRPLIDRLKAEKGRLRADLDRALEKLTGFSTGGDAARWESWWKVHGSAIEAGNFVREGAPGAREQATGVEFYGIRTLSDRIVFVLDISMSMKQPAGSKVPVTGTSDRVVQPAGDTKIDVARAQLETALLAMEEGAEFNIVFYRQTIEVLSPRMVRVDRRNLEKAFEFIDGHRAAGGTNIFDALHQALNPVEVLDSGARITPKNYEGLVDTVFLLSDGDPTYGRLMANDRMLREIERLNGYRKVVIHAIGIGQHNESFMKKLAEVTGGEYASFR